MFLKKIKKTIALALTLVTIAIPTGNAVSAMEIQNKTTSPIEYTTTLNQGNKDIEAKIKIIKDNENERIARVTLDNTVSISTYNKITGETKVEETNIDTNKTTVQTFQLGTSTETNPSIESRASNNSKWGKVAYNVSVTTWSIKNSKGLSKVRYENSSNSGNLLGFKASVDSCRRSENTAVSIVGASLVAGFLGAAAMPTFSAIVAVLAAAGAVIGGATYIYDALQYREDADWYYTRIG